MHTNGCCSFHGLMSLALPHSPSSLSTVLWRLVEGVDWHTSLTCRPRWWELHLPSILIGILVGLLLGPLCEAICAWRLQAYKCWVAHLAPAAPPRHRVRPLFRLQWQASKWKPGFRNLKNKLVNWLTRCASYAVSSVDWEGDWRVTVTLSLCALPDLLVLSVVRLRVRRHTPWFRGNRALTALLVAPLLHCWGVHLRQVPLLLVLELLVCLPGLSVKLSVIRLLSLWFGPWQDNNTEVQAVIRSIWLRECGWSFGTTTGTPSTRFASTGSSAGVHLWWRRGPTIWGRVSSWACHLTARREGWLLLLALSGRLTNHDCFTWCWPRVPGRANARPWSGSLAWFPNFILGWEGRGDGWSDLSWRSWFW